ncbi:GNAT family N-acetyltransferase, partial [Chloroflexota bacterium]
KGARNIQYLKYGVGNLYHMYAIREAIKRRLREVDFLKGDEPYKFHWTKSAREYQQIIMVNKSSCSGLRILFVRAFVRVCDIIQHHYSLREIYSLLKISRREKKERCSVGYAR